MESRRRTLLTGGAAAAAVVLVLVVVVLWRVGALTSAGGHYARAQAAAARGDGSGALERVEQALARDPTNPAFLSFKARTQLELGRAQDAAATFRRALAADPNRLEARLGLGASLLAVGQDDSARAALANMPLAGLDRDQARALARLRQRAGDLAGAYEALVRAAGPENLADRAALARELERWDDAAALYGELLARDSTDATVRAALAIVLDRGGRPEAAAAQYATLVETGRAEPAARVRYASHLTEAGRYEEALGVLAPLPRASADSAVSELRARAALGAGRVDEALAVIRPYLAVRPDDPRFQALLAEARAARERQRAAAEASFAADRTPLRVLASRAESLPPAQFEALVEAYRDHLEDAATDLVGRRELGALLESRGRWAEAADVYEPAAADVDLRDADLLLRLARAQRNAGRHAAALASYRRFVALPLPSVSRLEAAREIAALLLQTGNAADAVVALRSWADDEAAADSATLTLAVRAATAAGRFDDAARWAGQLAELAPVVARAQRLELAARLRAAGEDARALTEYARLAERAADPADSLWTVVGDLRMQTGDAAGAVDAYRRRAAGLPAGALGLRQGAALEALGRLDEAASAYAAYVRLHPDRSDALLALARVEARRGDAPAALAAYERATSAGGFDGPLAREIAEASLAARRFAEAERWARWSISMDDTPAARLVLARSLAGRGERAESGRLLDELAAIDDPSPAGRAFAARVAWARGRLLEAWRAFGEAIAAGAEDRADLAVERGRVAAERGDYARAERSLRQAAGWGADSVDVARARAAIDAAVAARIEAAATGATANGASVLRPGAALRFRPTAGIAAEVSVTRSELRGDAARLTSMIEAIGIDSVFITPALEAGGRLALEDRSGDGSRLHGSAAGRVHLASGGVVEASFASEPVWWRFAQQDHLRIERFAHIDAIVRELTRRRGGVRASLALGPATQALLEAAHAAYSDGNSRSYLFGRLQLPLRTTAGTWTILEPNAYLARTLFTRPAYFSPERYASLGLAGRLEHAAPAWLLRTSLNPHLFRSDTTSGAGLEGSLSGRWLLGPARIDIGTSMLLESTGFRLWNLSLLASFGLGGGGP